MMPATAAPIDDDAHQHALTLAALGLRVLPIKPGGKSPPMNSWQHAATMPRFSTSPLVDWQKSVTRATLATPPGLAEHTGGVRRG